MVLSDQLCVRAYSHHEAWRVGPMKVQTGDKTPPRTVSPTPDSGIGMSGWMATLSHQGQQQVKDELARIVSVIFRFSSVIDVTQRICFLA